MRVLVACEVSGRVRDAFRAKGHDAWSCDLQAADSPWHICGDVLEVLGQDWDMLIAHPPCTYLCVTGNKWFLPKYAERFPTRHQDREDAVRFFLRFAEATHIPQRAIENPVGIMSKRYRPPDQYIEPWHFGDRATKKTGLWLFGLPPLLSLGASVAGTGGKITFSSGKSMPRWYVETSRKKGMERSNERSLTFQGIANAMADQWGNLAPLTKDVTP